MDKGPNEDGAELYRLHLEAMTCETCGGCKEDRELHIFQSHEVIAALRAIVARVEDVEGMAKVISSLDPVKNTETGEVCSWDDLTDRYRELYRKDATALLRWLKEGRENEKIRAEK